MELGIDEKLELLKKEKDRCLEIFKKRLETEQLSKKTITKHVGNADFYIDNVNFHYVVGVKEGASDFQLSDFFGYYLIKNYSSPSEVKSVAASVKKFYQVMLDENIISKDDFNQVLEFMKEDIPNIIEEARDRYNSLY